MAKIWEKIETVNHITLYYATAQTFISLIQRKKESENFFRSKKLLFDRLAIQKF